MGSTALLLYVLADVRATTLERKQITLRFRAVTHDGSRDEDACFAEQIPATDAAAMSSALPHQQAHHEEEGPTVADPLVASGRTCPDAQENVHEEMQQLDETLQQQEGGVAFGRDMPDDHKFVTLSRASSDIAIPWGLSLAANTVLPETLCGFVLSEI